MFAFFRFVVLIHCVLLSVFGSTLTHAQQNSSNSFLFYTVERKDTIWEFSQAFLIGTDAWKEVVRINGVDEPKTLQPGRVLKIPKRLVRVYDVEVKVEELTGKAQALRPGKPESDIGKGDLLPVQSVIKTKENSRLSLRFPDGSIVIVPSNTQVRLDKLQQSAFTEINAAEATIERGKVEALVTRQSPEDSFQLKTRRAVAGVRGTEFRFGENQDQETLLEVLTGEVALIRPDGGELFVGTQQAANVTADGQVNALPLPSRPEILAESTTQIAQKIKIYVSKRDTAEKLRVQVSNSSSFLSPSFDSNFDSDQVILPDLQAGTYFVSVSKIQGPQLESEPSVVMIDRLLTAKGKVPSAIQLNKEGRALTLDWPAYSRAVSYQVMFSSNPNVNDPFLNERTDKPRLTLCCVKPGVYFWRVFAFDSKGKLLHESRVNNLLLGAEVTLPLPARSVGEKPSTPENANP